MIAGEAVIIGFWINPESKDPYLKYLPDYKTDEKHARFMLKHVEEIKAPASARFDYLRRNLGYGNAFTEPEEVEAKSVKDLAKKLLEQIP